MSDEGTTDPEDEWNKDAVTVHQEPEDREFFGMPGAFDHLVPTRLPSLPPPHGSFLQLRPPYRPLAPLSPEGSIPERYSAEDTDKVIDMVAQAHALDARILKAEARALAERDTDTRTKALGAMVEAAVAEGIPLLTAQRILGRALKKLGL